MLEGILPASEVFLRTSFRVGGMRTRRHFEEVARALLAGFRAALHSPSSLDMLTQIKYFSPDGMPLFCEGVGLGCSLTDRWNNSHFFEELCQLAPTIEFPLTIGAGWGIAWRPRWRQQPEDFYPSIDTSMPSAWLIGYGCQKAYFHWARYVEGHFLPAHISEEGLQTFDQGIGRIIWFGEAGDPELVAACIGAFPPFRQRDLWSGVGFGCDAASDFRARGLRTLREACGPWTAYLAEGAALAATIRYQSGVRSPGGDEVCRIACGASLADTANVVTALYKELQRGPRYERYNRLRQRIRAHFQARRSEY
jgi:enediyne biosynthesis protein E3